MKKAPKGIKRKGYFEGGETTLDDPKKPLNLKLSPEEWDKLNKEHGNVEYGTAAEGRHKQYYDPKLTDVTKDEFGNLYSYRKDGKKEFAPEIYSYEYKASPKKKEESVPLVYGNYSNGKQTQYQGTPIKKAKGGTVMKKAPCKMKKGGTC